MLRGDKTSSDNMYQLGRRMGEILSKLHSRDILYNDVTWTDDMGKSHLIIPETTPAILIDYGVALRLNNHPNLTDEEVFNYARTLPGVNFTVESYILQQGEITKQQLEAIAQEYMPSLEKTTKEHVMERDLDFINEGLTFATYRLGNHIVKPFLKGFQETYK